MIIKKEVEKNINQDIKAIEALERLGQLRDKGLITESEFEKKKQNYLDKI